MKRLAGIVVLAGAAVLLLAAVVPAFAYLEPGTSTGTVGLSCRYCHQRWNGFVWLWQYRPSDGGDCTKCHADYEMGEFTGPHAGYTATSRKCSACHDVHDPGGGLQLLPSSTILGTCRTCHDGTGGWGVYGAVKANTGADPAGAHRIDATATIPGGDVATGGEASRTFLGVSGRLTCTDCHSPHGADIVQPFASDRSRVRAINLASTATARLLKRRPSGAASPTAEYGSDWCLGCHAGRSSAGPVHNHPVDSTARRADTFVYRNVAIAATDAPTTQTVLAQLGGVPTFADVPVGGRPHTTTWTPSPNASGNRGYVMPFPRTAQQSGHAPICQQCHEDSREAGDTDDSGRADAAVATVGAGDGMQWSSATNTWTPAVNANPRFQNFPHETVNRRLLVETNDDLCVNCHPATLLP